MAIKIIKYIERDSFKKEFKKLKKKFKTLDEDIKVAKKNAIELFHLFQMDNQSVELMIGFQHAQFQFYKLRKFACKALKGRGVKSGIRIIYAYCLAEASVTFIEIYFKAAQENEDKSKIKKFLEEIK